MYNYVAACGYKSIRTCSGNQEKISEYLAEGREAHEEQTKLEIE